MIVLEYYHLLNHHSLIYCYQKWDTIQTGTIPSGRGAYPNSVCILLGFVAMLFHALFTSEFAINKTGRYDIFTEIYLRFASDKEGLLQLKEDAKIAYETGKPVPLPSLEKSDDEDEDKENEMTERLEAGKEPFADTKHSSADECDPIVKEESSTIEEEEVPPVEVTNPQ